MTTPTDLPEGAPLRAFDREQTAALLDFAELVSALAQAAQELEAGAIACPERLVVPMGAGGVLLSMPAAAADIAIHKLVTVQPANRQRQLPTIHGLVTACDAATGRPLCLLDGPELTARRTATVSMLALRTLLAAPPGAVLLIGTGVQAASHVLALAALHPQATVWVQGRAPAAAEAFCHALRGRHPGLRACGAQRPDQVDAVITLTTSQRAIYDEPARPGRLVIGVGAFKPEMAEIGAATLAGSGLIADDPKGARHEAGDLLQAGVDWGRVGSLGQALRQPPDLERPWVFKSVGSAAWDLAAARVALRRLGAALAR
ncbi:MAG: delta(1)-pyrroline-2-carboxylate reductase family protein [Burkholderiales bacterium]|nr:delta(1)-pyrroline-2-carboxylate reductase family protein [Burkholderiales bacterium]